MKNYGVFDILGPIMIGPSSSHTAGAVRLANIAKVIIGEEVKHVKFYLHGSFAKTYRGHGTDRALVAGMMEMTTWDERIKDSFNIAEEKGISWEFIEADLGDSIHPNTVRFEIEGVSGKEVSVVGSSIGGGSIKVFEVDNQPVEFTGEYTTLLLRHKDVPGMISKVSTLLYNEDVNIAFMNVFRSAKGVDATMVFEIDNKLTEKAITKIKELDGIESVRKVDPLKGE